LTLHATSGPRRRDQFGDAAASVLAAIVGVTQVLGRRSDFRLNRDLILDQHALGHRPTSIHAARLIDHNGDEPTRKKWSG